MSEHAYDAALAWLEEYGILLVVDPLLPSITTAVTGEPLKGSWWGHPQSHAIWAVAERMEGMGNVLQMKLVSGKVTYVHRRLWPALAGVASARDPWQVEGLSPDEEKLLGVVGERGWVRTDEPGTLASFEPRTVRRAAKGLERNLLVVSRQVHTEWGAHAKALETWESWATRIGFREPWKTAKEGRRELEETLESVNRIFGAKGRLPWQAS